MLHTDAVQHVATMCAAVAEMHTPAAAAAAAAAATAAFTYRCIMSPNQDQSLPLHQNLILKNNSRFAHQRHCTCTVLQGLNDTNPKTTHVFCFIMK
jgi:hypothetical protein